MKKIMISVAPVAATDILINPRAIARDVYECYKNGASMVHLHCRDLNGNLTPDLSLLEETVAYIREMCDIVVEISTGGVSNLTIEERVQPCYPSWVEANSLNVGSVTPASLRAAIPAAMAPAMRGSTVSPTAVVTSSAPAIWAASSGLRESIAEMSVMRICSQTVSMI